MTKINKPFFVGGKEYIIKPSKGSFALGFSNYSGSSRGIYRTFSFAQKVFESGLYFPDKLLFSQEKIKDCEIMVKWLSSAKKLLIIPKITSYTLKGFTESFFSWCKSDEKSVAKARFALAYKSIEMISDSSSLFQLFSIPIIKKLFLQRVGASAKFILSTLFLKKLWTEDKSFLDLLHKTSQSNHNEALKTLVKEKWRLSLMRTVSKTIDVAIGVLALIGFLHAAGFLTVLSGSFLISGLTLWSLGAISCSVSLGSEVYESSMSYYLSPQERKPFRKGNKEISAA